jgi:hypothetical protein
LIAVCDDELIPFDPPPFSLRTQAQRPGELAELIDIDVDATIVSSVQKNAAAAGLPCELAVYITIEAERALAEAVEVVGVSRAELSDFLDVAASDVRDPGPRHVLVRPLEEYARALTRGVGEVEVLPGPLRARVPHRVAAVWAHAAAAAGIPLERWLADIVVDAAVVDRTPWEAAAARAGRALSEWVLLQATRCARSRNTSPQMTASD